MSRIVSEMLNVEYESVKRGVRNAAIQGLSANQLLALQRRTAEDGLSTYLLGIESANGIYSASSREWNGKGAPQFRTAIINSQFVKRFAQAVIEFDNSEIGRLLGYPDCCIRFFQKYWIEEKWVDTTYPMAQGRESFETPPENNILLRWVGVRLVPHLPCSFGCRWTRAFALQLESLWNSEVLADAKEMLSWPVEWSALHGIAEITTPVFKIGTRTDATAGRHIVKVNPGVCDPNLHLLNGFKDSHGMEAAHGVLLGEALSLKGIKSVLDLGCGNGYFLDKLRTIWELPVAVGVDINHDAIEFARQEFPNVGAIQSDLFDLPDTTGWRYDLAIFMPGRLDEQPNFEKREKLLRWLRETATYVLLYGYDDWSWLVPRLANRFFNYQWDRISSTESRRATTVLLKARA